MLNWLNQNAGAVQGMASVAVVFLTAGLVWVTYRYTRLTHRMAKCAENQLKASVEPPILDIASEIEPSSRMFRSGTESDYLGVNVIVTNVGGRPVKIVNGTVTASVNGRNVGEVIIREMKDCILMPSHPADAYARILVSRNVDKTSARVTTLIRCTDLAEISEHSYVRQPNGNIRHRSCFIKPKQPSLWTRFVAVVRGLKTDMDQLENE